MSDDWERIDGKQATKIELLNYDSQVNFIKSLYLFWERCAEKEHCHDLNHPTEDALKDLHRLGTLLLLKDPGQYRKHRVVVTNQDGDVIYTPPPFTDVPRLVQEMFEHLDAIWESEEGHEIAAYLLWRINWIHPFVNGNGRTARGFAYACLCLKSGCYLPGKETIIDLIKQDRQPLYDALRDADHIYATKKTIDVTKLSNYIYRLYIQQLQSAGVEFSEEDLEIAIS